MLEKTKTNLEYPIIFSGGKEKELIEHLDINKQIESLVKNIKIEERIDGSALCLEFTINGESVCYAKILNLGFQLSLLNFYTSNARNKIDKDDLYYYSMQKMYKGKIPLLGLSSLIILFKYIKKNFKITTITLNESSFASSNEFYQKSFNYMREKGYIKDYKKRGRNYSITI